MERLSGRKHKQSEVDTTVRHKLRKGDANAPMIVLPDGQPKPQQQEQRETMSEQLQDVDYRMKLVGVPLQPIASDVAPPSSIQGGTHLARRGSLDSTDGTFLHSTALGFPADGSAARVGSFGAFSNAGPLHGSDDAGGNAQSESGLSMGAGPSKAPAEAVVGLAAADASMDMIGIFERLLTLPLDEQLLVLENVGCLSEMKLCRVVHGREVARGKTKGHSVVACRAFVVFSSSVEQLGGCSDDAAFKLLAKAKPVQSSLGASFHTTFAARQAACQKQPSGAQQLLVAECAQKFLVYPSVKVQQRQLLYTTDSAAMDRRSKTPMEWPEADAAQSKLAVNLLVAAACRLALGTHPGVPPGLKLFSVEAQPRKTTAAGSTFNGMLQKLFTG